jgi:hypothetical protein
MNHQIAFETARLQLSQVSRRAELISRLGDLPRPRPLLPFRRRVISLPAAIEVRRAR